MQLNLFGGFENKKKSKWSVKLHFDLIYNHSRDITSELQQDRESHSLLCKGNQR